MRAFIVKQQSVLVNFWLESPVVTLCKILVIGSSNWTFKYNTRSFAIAITFAVISLLDDFCGYSVLR